MDTRVKPAYDRTFQPFQNDAGNCVGVSFHHQHMAVAANTAIAEIAKLSLRPVLVEPDNNGAIDLPRMVEVSRAGYDQDALAGELLRLRHAQLAAVHVL